MTLAPGAKLGPYEIVAPLGSGGMGEVYERATRASTAPSRSRSCRRTSAASREMRERFEREARAISALNHPHICTLHDVGHQDGIDFLVMELLEGETLDARLEKGSAVPRAGAAATRWRSPMRSTRRIAQGVVHRDLKPANVMLTQGRREAARLRAGEARGDGERAGSGGAISADLPSDGRGAI